MKKLKQKMELGLFRSKIAIKNFMGEECGDTNFLSIAIILIVVITVAVVFIMFKDQLLGWLQQSINDLKSALGV